MEIVSKNICSKDFFRALVWKVSKGSKIQNPPPLNIRMSGNDLPNSCSRATIKQMNA